MGVSGAAATSGAGCSYVELRAHSAFSFGAAAVTPERLAEQGAALGYSALGLTDTADFGGVVRFALACARVGMRPLIGVELAMTEDVPGATRPRPVALLVRTAAGYHALAALVTRARSGQLASWMSADHGQRAGALPRGRPQVPWGAVAAAAAGGQDLVLLTGPTSGRLAALMRQGRSDEAALLLGRYRAAFGDACAVEVHQHLAGRAETTLAGDLIALAESAGVRWVVTGDARYVDAAGRAAFDVLVALARRRTLATAAAEGWLLPNDQWRLQDPAAVAARWQGRAAGLAATHAIAALCAPFDLRWARPPMPAFPVPAGETVDSYLRAQVDAGARERWGDQLADAQRAQLDHELAMIARLGFSGFFLVMWDAVREARTRGILAQGRGSAANNAVAFVLGITAVDPVKYGLLFERFLSEARTDASSEAPDIDVDFEAQRREELLDYTYDRYGRAHAALTCVVQTYSASTAVHDVGRAFGVPIATVRALSVRLHHVDPADGARVLHGGLAAEHGLDVTTPRGRALLEAAAAFEGLPRLRSTHPGGFVLSARALADCVPVEPTTMGRTVLQYDKDDLDALGIPKFDFLGLGALSAVRHAFDLIERRTGERPMLYGLPRDDPATFAMISRGETFGTFQIESRAQIASLVHTRPEVLYDLVVQIALIRPGPIVAQFVHPYTQRRRGLESVTYPEGMADVLMPILGRTQGIPIFQEQAMALAIHVAGYTPAEADQLRRTMGNERKAERLAAALATLRERLQASGVRPAVAHQLVADLRGFANYGFPESHAWSFALIAYATAYLRAHHSAAFYAGLLDAQPMGFYSVATLAAEARRGGVEVRRPCLAVGDAACTLEERDEWPDAPALRIGWRHVRNMSDGAVARLTAARQRAPFRGIPDVVRRAQLDRRDATALARAHALALWAPDPQRATWEALGAVGETRDHRPLAPTRPGGGGHTPAPRDAHATVAADYAALGLSVDGHPMQRYRAWCQRTGVYASADLRTVPDGEVILVAGAVTHRQKPSTAKGTIFLTLEDEHGGTNVIVFPNVDARDGEAVRRAPYALVLGRVDRDGPLVHVIATRVAALPPACNETGHRSRDFR